MSGNILENFAQSPIVAAVKEMEGLESALQSDSGLIFVLFGDICNIREIVDKIKNGGKKAFVHVDLIEGLSPKEISVRFLKENTAADGIISTKAPLIKAARELNLITVQRFFILDSLSLSGVIKHIQMKNADMIEILPGVLPKIISELTAMTRTPIIAGGLISDKKDIFTCLGAGAAAVSTTKSDLWFL